MDVARERGRGVDERGELVIPVSDERQARIAKERAAAEELLARPRTPREPGLVLKEWRLPEPAREPRERGLDTSPAPVPDWDAWNRWADERIRSALTEHEAAMTEAIGESLGSALAGIDRNLADLKREMLAELAELRVTVANVRVQLAEIEIKAKTSTT